MTPWMDQVDADFLSLEKIKQGNEAGLKELMERHREALFRFIYRYVQNESDAAELTEQTFLRVYQSAGKFRPKAKVGTWIFSIAGNLCRDSIRKSRRRGEVISMNAPIAGGNGSEWEDTYSSEVRNPEESAVSREALQAIESSIHDLPHKLRFPFIYCILEDNSYEACAEVLKISRKTVEMRIYRARKRLQQEMAELFENL